MKRLLRAVVAVIGKRSRNTPCSRLDWRGRPRDEAPTCVPSERTPLPSARPIYDTLVLSEQRHD
jgi:hypothetical protein